MSDTIASCIKNTLAKRSIKIKDIAKKLNIEPCNLSRKLNNDTVTLKEAVEIADYLNCSLDELIGRNSGTTRRDVLELINELDQAGQISFWGHRQRVITTNQQDAILKNEHKDGDSLSRRLSFEGKKYRDVMYISFVDDKINKALCEASEENSEIRKSIFEKYQKADNNRPIIPKAKKEKHTPPDKWEGENELY